MRIVVGAMPSDAYLAMVERLGREFAKRRMTKHLGSLRSAWPTLKAWREETVIEWMRCLRIPPFEKDYPVLNSSAACPKCAKSEGVWTRLVFPGGAQLMCSGCKAVWLVEHS